MTKDILKESLFESLGWSDRDWSRKLSQAAIDLLFEFAASLLSKGHSCLLEANFRSDCAQKKLKILKARHDFSLAQIFLWAQPGVLQLRMQERASRGKRHQGHVDTLLQHEYNANSIPKTQLTPVNEEGPILRLETTYIDAALAADHRARVKTWMIGLGLPPREAN